MPLDTRGIHQFTESDTQPTFSALLNLGMSSVSNSKAFFKGTQAQRAALDPAPAGAYWQDTDGSKQLWSAGPSGQWRRHEGQSSIAAGAWEVTNGPVRARSVDVIIPTALASNETLLVSTAYSNTTFALVELANIVTRAASSTTIRVRHIQFFSNATPAATFNWQVANGT